MLNNFTINEVIDLYSHRNFKWAPSDFYLEQSELLHTMKDHVSHSLLYDKIAKLGPRISITKSIAKSRTESRFTKYRHISDHTKHSGFTSRFSLKSKYVITLFTRFEITDASNQWWDYRNCRTTTPKYLDWEWAYSRCHVRPSVSHRFCSVSNRLRDFEIPWYKCSHDVHYTLKPFSKK